MSDQLDANAHTTQMQNVHLKLASSPGGSSVSEGACAEAVSREVQVNCLLTTLSPERSLSRALVQHLSAEMPGIKFSLRAPKGCTAPDALWVCGYRRGNAQLIQKLRARYPDAAMIVTGRGPIASWKHEVLQAGADTTCTWPLPYRRLASLLKQGRDARAHPA